MAMHSASYSKRQIDEQTAVRHTTVGRITRKQTMHSIFGGSCVEELITSPLVLRVKYRQQF